VPLVTKQYNLVPAKGQCGISTYGLMAKGSEISTLLMLL